MQSARVSETCEGQLYALICSTLFRVNRLPHQRKALVKPKLLPHFKALFSPEGSTFNQPVNTSVRKAIFMSSIVETKDLSERGVQAVSQYYIRLFQVH